MLWRAGVADLAGLRKRWQEWVTIVEFFARRRGVPYRMDLRTYRRLHGGLLDELLSHAGSSDGEQRVFFLRLEELASPWLTPEALARTDREILYDLLNRCHQAEWELGAGRKWIYRAARWAGAIVILEIVAALGILVWRMDPGWLPLWAHVHSWLDEMQFALVMSGQTHWLLGAGSLVILVSIYAISRSTRQ
jgi:hypothetical protein